MVVLVIVQHGGLLAGEGRWSRLGSAGETFLLAPLTNCSCQLPLSVHLSGCYGELMSAQALIGGPVEAMSSLLGGFTLCCKVPTILTTLHLQVTNLHSLSAISKVWIHK